MAPRQFLVPFRGSTLLLWADTPPGELAIIAQLSLADPRFDRFHRAAGTVLRDLDGKQVFPPVEEEVLDFLRPG